MADTYTPFLRMTEPEPAAVGDIWGNKLNLGVSLIGDAAITGEKQINIGSSTSYALAAMVDGTLSDSHYYSLEFTGTPASAVTITIPTSVTRKQYRIKNSTGKTITVKYSTGTGVSIDNGYTTIVWCDGTNVLNGVPATSVKYDITPAEIALSIIPANPNIPTGDAIGLPNLMRYVPPGTPLDGSYDFSAALTTVMSIIAYMGFGSCYAPSGVYKYLSEVSLVSNLSLYGDGEGKTVFLDYHATNPASSSFMLAARSKSNISISDLTLKSNSYADGLFNVGTYTPGPPKTYSGSLNGNINGLLISSCTDVSVTSVEVTGFNYDGIRTSVENSTDYNERLVFDRIHGHHCLSTPLDILGAKDFKVINCTFTDNGNFTDSYIDGGTGYGVVLGRLPSGSQLRSFGGLCDNNHCARNARHGIDVHAGGNITISNNFVYNNLLQGISYQDNSGSADDTLVGDAIITGNQIWHTSWVEAQYPLLTWIDSTHERLDSIPIYVSQVGAGLLKNVTVVNNHVRSWRFRQIGTNIAGTDLIGMIAVWATGNATIAGNTFEQTNAAYLPSFGLDVTAASSEIGSNTWKCSQRSTVSKPFFNFNTTGNCNIFGNHFELTNIYTDAGVTQAAYPMFKANSSIINMSGGNSIIQSSQGTRGSLWYTTGTDQKWGFNGIMKTNVGNQIKIAGTAWMEYSSTIMGSLTIYLGDSGSGIFDGMSSANRFVATNAAQFLAIINDMPRCESGLTVMIEADHLDWGSDAGVTIPDWQDNITFRGLSSETANSMTKTGGIKTTGNNLITCPERSQNINFEYLYLKSAGTSVVYRPGNVKYCAVEGLTNGQIGIACEYKSSYVRNTRFKGPGAGTSIAIVASLGARVVSQANDSDASQFAYGLSANSAAVYKNGTQPTGATANELTQNGGTIA